MDWTRVGGKENNLDTIFRPYFAILFFGFHFAIIFAPNLIVQYLIGPSRGVPLFISELLNFLFFICAYLAFMGKRSLRWPMLAMVAISVYSCNFLWNFGSMPSVGSYYSMINTNRMEFYEYVAIKYRLILLILLVGLFYYTVYPGLTTRFESSLNKFSKMKYFIACFLLMVAIAIGVLVTQERHRDEPAPRALAVSLRNSFPLGFFQGAWHASTYILSHRSNPQRPPLHAVRPGMGEGREVVVLVIGESASSNYWSLNGYPYPTNARVKARQDAGDLIYFSRAYAQANLTHFALPMLFTAATPTTYEQGQNRPTLLNAFTETGFATHWIANQEHQLYPGDADSSLFVSQYDFPGRKLGPSYDETMLPFIAQAITGPSRKVFLVVHLLGSHANYFQRVPPAFATPGLGTRTFEQEYARTICYTDYVLDAILRQLEQVDGRCFLWYVSDHGEVPQKSDVGHGRPEPVLGELQIPMFIWANQAFRSAAGPAFQRLQSHRQEPVSQGATFPTILGLAGITYPQMDPTRDLSSPSYLPPQAFRVLAPDGTPRDLTSSLR